MTSYFMDPVSITIGHRIILHLKTNSRAQFAEAGDFQWLFFLFFMRSSLPFTRPEKSQYRHQTNRKGCWSPYQTTPFPTNNEI
jgi:hypothetical protein